MANDHLSITGRGSPPLELTGPDRSRYWVVFLYPVVAMMTSALRLHWITASLWAIWMLGVLGAKKFGQPAAHRTGWQKQVLLVFMLVPACLLIVAPVNEFAPWRLVGLALTPLPFLIDIAIAQTTKHRA